MNHAGESFPAGFPVCSPAIAGVFTHERKALAIVGSHPNGREGIPWDDPGVEIMLFNEAPMRVEKYPRWDVCLQIHGPEVYAQEHNWVNKDYWPWLQERHDKPIYMQAVDERVPDSIEYPLEGILSMIPYRYLRSSPAMGLALAIYLGYKEIWLFGSELTSNTEYNYQANNYAFWIGFAHGRGIDLRLRCWLSEFNQRIYGYEGELQLEKAYFLARQVEHEKAWRTNDNVLYKLKSRLDDAMLENRYDDVGSLSIDLEDAAMNAGETYAIMNEAKRYAERANLISRQEFERTSAQAQQDGDKLRSDKDHAGGKCEYVWNVWRQTGNHAALNQLRTFIKDKTDLAFQVGEKLGIFRENMTYMVEYDELLTAAGGIRALGRQE